MVDAVNASGPGGIDVYIRTMVTSVIKEGTALRGIVAPNNAQLRGKVLIDATEYGDLLALAGARYRVGNGRSDSVNLNACVQDITYSAVMRKYVKGVPNRLKMSAAPAGYAEAKATFANVVAQNGSMTLRQFPVNFRFHNAYRGMPDSSVPGSYISTDYALITKTGINWANDHAISARVVEDRHHRKHVACQAKLKTIQFLYYVQSELGVADWSIADDQQYDTAYNRAENSCSNIPSSLKEIEWRMPQMPYVREARRAIGTQTLAARDIKRSGSPAAAEKTFETAVAMGAYPMDLHGCKAPGDLEADLESIDETQGFGISGFFQIPYEVLVPSSMDGLLLAEKNLSQSRLVNGATRLQPSTMLVGQAAGAAASLAASQGKAPRDISPVAVQWAVTKAGSFISKLQFPDVPKTHSLWRDIQLATARGIMTGYGKGLFGPNDAVTRGEAAVIIARLFKLVPPSSAVQGYTDVPTDHWAYPSIQAIATAGFTDGFSASPQRYHPGRITTRAQFAMFVARGLGYSAFTPTGQTYSDAPTSHVAYAFIEYLDRRRIRVPCGGSMFCPDVPLRRGEAARLIAQTVASMAGHRWPN